MAYRSDREALLQKRDVLREELADVERRLALRERGGEPPAGPPRRVRQRVLSVLAAATLLAMGVGALGLPIVRAEPPPPTAPPKTQALPTAAPARLSVGPPARPGVDGLAGWSGRVTSRL